jgi:hypothetical protein
LQIKVLLLFLIKEPIKLKIMETATIGKNAGIVWRYLNNKRDATMTQLIDGTNLSKENILLAIGWLARENKIIFVNGKESTELKYSIDMNFYF